MAAIPMHARTQSRVPSASNQAVTSSRLPMNWCHARTVSTDITPHNYTEYNVKLVDHTRNSFEELQVATPPKAATLARSDLGSQFLSSISNAQPAAASLSRKGSVLHSRAKSLAAIVPKLGTSNTSTPQRSRSPNKLIHDLFSGESAPIRLGAPVSPTKEREESDFIMEYKPSFTERPFGMLGRRQTAPQAPADPPKSASSEQRFTEPSMLRSRQTPPQISTSTLDPPAPTKSSWFGRKAPKPMPSTPQPRDDFATLDINTALFPNGPVDPLNPASFNDLLLMATSLLLRMQAAYKEKVEYIASVRPELDAQQDELEGAETRAEHLKKQLEEMSERVHQQEKTMKEIASELAEEKIKSHEAQQALAAAKSIRVVPSLKDEVRIGEPEGALRARRRGSISNASDSGFESDLDSIFSSYSVPGTPVSAPDTSFNPTLESRTENSRQANDGETAHVKRRPSPGTNNSHAQRLGREGAAWATVDVLRTENRELKKQLSDLHETLQGCIELVSIVGNP